MIAILGRVLRYFGRAPPPRLCCSDYVNKPAFPAHTLLRFLFNIVVVEAVTDTYVSPTSHRTGILRSILSFFRHQCVKPSTLCVTVSINGEHLQSPKQWTLSTMKPLTLSRILMCSQFVKLLAFDSQCAKKSKTKPLTDFKNDGEENGAIKNKKARCSISWWVKLWTFAQTFCATPLFVIQRLLKYTANHPFTLGFSVHWVTLHRLWRHVP